MQVAAPGALPGGMSIQVLDCAGAQLSMVTAGAVAAFRVFAAMGLYYPERMARGVIVNAPSWFEMPW